MPALAPVMSTVLPTKREALKTDILRQVKVASTTRLCIFKACGSKESRIDTEGMLSQYQIIRRAHMCQVCRNLLLDSTVPGLDG